MKLHLKISLLLLSFAAVLIISFTSITYVNRAVQDVFMKENERNQAQIIDKVIAIKFGSLKQIVDDNSAWDELIEYTHKPDSVWAIDNIDFMVNVFNHSTVMVFNQDDELIHQFSDSSLIGSYYQPDKTAIKNIFAQSAYCHYFQYSGNQLIEFYGATIVPSADATERKTEPQGYLLVGEEWDEAYLNNLYESTGFDTELIATTDSSPIELDRERECIIKELHGANGKTVAKVVFSRVSPIQRDLNNFLLLTLLISFIALLALIVFILYFRRILVEPFSIINRTLETNNQRFLDRLRSKTPEFVKLKELILNFFKQQEELKSNNARLLELNGTKDKLFSIIGHDLRNPIGNILSASGIMIESIQEQDSENIEILLSLIEKESGEALNLLETLLDWAKTQTGKLQYSPKRVHLKEIIDRVSTNLSFSARMKEIKIETVGNVDFEVYADYNMIVTILRNLISNAIKFTNPGGWIRISALRNENEIEFQVEDNGIGMDVKAAGRLFKAETNYSTYGTANEKGTGLGLIICKEFIEKHGGSIRVESEKGKGSCFIFNIVEKKISQQEQ
ncbi:ATP-binding protein [Mangrovibacterium marinum]|uniref:histidine kinase n=1 Tax=Mangrovibacterium marinum TaxID=1639118 RepID=A0A2T5C4Z9_9BACT|nr:ATP-binding protein [Mangrovibacterium marinum]PTN09917.1 signal transduction histidine kinase [Mangrovibacterium marinum]